MSRLCGPDVAEKGLPIGPDPDKTAGLSILDEGMDRTIYPELLDRFAPVSKLASPSPPPRFPSPEPVSGRRAGEVGPLPSNHHDMSDTFRLSRGEPRIDGGNVVVPYRGNYGTATMGKTKYSLCGSPDVPRDQRGLGLTP